MVFSSPVFLFLFLPIVLLLVLTARDRKRQNTLLLIASLFFYAWGEGAYVLLMLVMVLVNYLAALATQGAPGTRSWIAMAIILNLGVLVWFKYANFLVDSSNTLLEGLALPLMQLDPVHLPIGISFFVFQGISYVIDVYRGHAKAQTKPGSVALYISLFPQLIAGPIVRYSDVAEQIDQRSLNVPLFASGVRRFIIGLAKKVLIADQVARIAEPIFELDAGVISPGVAWLGIIAYSIQIYFDFSGYSDMAIGLGRMFGFRFLENFDLPYIARSVREFWQRWHISLSTWFRDYLYIPLGGNRTGPVRTYVNLFIVFLLTGLWHGASWNFVIWGLIHGSFMIMERTGAMRWIQRTPRSVGTAYTLLVVLVAWVFFRVEDLTDAWHFVLGMFHARSFDAITYTPAQFLTRTSMVALAIGVLGALNVHGFIASRMSWNVSEERIPVGARGMLQVVGLALLLIMVGMHVASSTFSPFIYFRF